MSPTLNELNTQYEIAYLYPESHWEELKRFAVGEEMDPKGCFSLASDEWNALKYSDQKLPTMASQFRFNFGGLRSVLKLYVKWFCYNQLMGRVSPINKGAKELPIALQAADRFIFERGFKSLSEIALAEVFRELWRELAVGTKKQSNKKRSNSPTVIWRQAQTRVFWLELSSRFGSPLVVPPIMFPPKPHPTEIAADTSNRLPDIVIRQFSNRLSLHRDGKQLLNRFHHLRLCILMLTICTGRRINEILTAPRGSGPEGPLLRALGRTDDPHGALWLVFSPNKGGPENKVLISAAWEETTEYCVRQLLRYGDEVRHLAAPEERDHLVLVSKKNFTKGNKCAAMAAADAPPEMLTIRGVPLNTLPQAVVLTYIRMYKWLNGADKSSPGMLERWNITADGSPNGKIYGFKTNQARHRRATVLASDPNVPPVVRQKDLNHRSLNTQLNYQHNLDEQRAQLLEKFKTGQLMGNGIRFLETIVGENESVGEAGFQPGLPSIADERFRRLIRNNPLFFQPHRVPPGFCVKPYGPAGCSEYLCCVEAGEGGCDYFVSDVMDDEMVREIESRVNEHRLEQERSLSKGQTVRAEKYSVLGDRAEDMHRRFLDLRDRLLREG